MPCISLTLNWRRPAMTFYTEMTVRGHVTEIAPTFAGAVTDKLLFLISRAVEAACVDILSRSNDPSF
jgi:hypothetical protein